MRQIQAVGVHSRGSGHHYQTKGNRNPHALPGNQQQNASTHQKQTPGDQCIQSASTNTRRNPPGGVTNATTKTISNGVACNGPAIAIPPSNATDELQTDSIEFFECSYCGLSTFDSDSVDDQKVDFALCGSKQRKLSTKIEGESQGSSKKVTIKKCSRCTLVGYCSRDCQRKDYANHKAVCREIGQAKLKPSTLDTTTTYRSSVLQPSTTQATLDAYKQLAIKGRPAPVESLSNVFGRINRDISRNQNHIVVHCESSAGPEHCFAGVYTLTRTPQLSYVRDSNLTDLLSANKDLALLKRLGFALDFQHTEAKHVLAYQLLKHGESAWCLTAESRDIFCIEANLTRSEDRAFWNDPMSLFCLHPSNHYGNWLTFLRHRATPEKHYVGIALTPLETLNQAIVLAGPPKIFPLKYRQAPDFTAWDKQFILHTDHRRCRVPLEWIDSCMGVYVPLPGKVMNGYPVWKKSIANTRDIVDSESKQVKKYLERKGIRISLTTESQMLCVCRNMWGSLLLTVSQDEDFDFDSQQCIPILQASYLPENVDELLSVPTALFTTPDDAFSTWNAAYHGVPVCVNVAITPREYFEHTIALASLDSSNLESALFSNDLRKTTAKKKKKKQRKKFAGGTNKTAHQALEFLACSKEMVSKNTAVPTLKETCIQKGDCGSMKQSLEGNLSYISNESVDRTSSTHQVFKHISAILGLDSSIQGLDSSSIPSEISAWSATKALQCLFNSEDADVAWLQLNDSITSSVLKAALNHDESSIWIRENASHILELFVTPVRQNDLTVLFTAGITATAKSILTLFANLPEGKGHQFNNKIVKILCLKVNIIMSSGCDFKLLLASASRIIGKNTKKDFIDALKKSFPESVKNKIQKTIAKPLKMPKPLPVESQPIPKSRAAEIPEITYGDETNRDELEKPGLTSYDFRAALQWYKTLLEDLLKEVPAKGVSGPNGQLEQGNPASTADTECEIPSPKNLAHALTPEEVGLALATNDLSEDKLTEVEAGIDLFDWGDTSECWAIDITENAHKWFKKHIKRDRFLCERVMRRLTMLSTGRWPYVLCKPLHTRSKKLRLYETKIDAASRIIWEVAVAFSPRRSSLEHNFCEQVIRVWDIVLDHDNLSRTINQTIERIEKSHLRGEECAMYAEIDRSRNIAGSSTTKEGGISVPRVFPMTQEIRCLGTENCRPLSRGKTNHFHPASDDPRQFTLLKFYELNSSAIAMLLDGNDENIDLPFTPGPKEHAIIHHHSDPQKSILLMGRSGTGKTTCLVFRMWAQYISYNESMDCKQPRQVFLTKNSVLCNEVMRSFNNMGLAWRKRSKGNPNNFRMPSPATEKISHAPRFLTSSEWLDKLDEELPGDPFFTPLEREQRKDTRKQKDNVTTGVEALLSDETITPKSYMLARQEMNFISFQKFWRKIRSGSGSQIDSVLVWREIQSFIKGSVAALHIDREERDFPQNKFLSLEEYLAMPRKQSRMDETQRREIYSLFCSYEKLKRDLAYYDECDLVYNIAGRISLMTAGTCSLMDTNDSRLLSIDSLFVDEVQDFTQAELYIMAKLCRDPNNMFLAGDTAQSIAVGVDFRFTDVRQIFYNHFGGIEPQLLQLTHNYRSHAGVLRLAACVVELLYYFFSNSLDKLPPDLGLFDGPKPVIMEVSSTEELVLMLDGAKRETARIEFGAHQVVIVRSEEAKKNLPDEFGVDKDWVMTVQESKGLEFDDVLLYNFFSDSTAGDLWRVVTNYTKDHINAYYTDAMVASSGVQRYRWENLLLNETRHLEFSGERHKILETELKQLYTAITRARVNVFIAETNTDKSRPMFNYFRKRCVVDYANKDKAEGLSDVRVFGAMNTIEDWKNRGEYYLQNAEGERQRGCLRLAAKCFDKAGDVKRRDFALAFLSYTEFEDCDSTRKKGKHRREKLLQIAKQLLEARDVGFLNKAALCLLRAGENDVEAALMFELYARLCYAARLRDEKGDTTLPLAPSMHESKYFSYAARLFLRSSTQSSAKSAMALDSLRNFLCAKLYDDAGKLLSSGTFPLQEAETFKQLYMLCAFSTKMDRDPISSFRIDFQQQSDECKTVSKAITVAARIGCRSLYKKDKEGFVAAMSLLSKSERIQFLMTVREDVDYILANRPWGDHCFFCEDKEPRKGEVILDLTQMLICELEQENKVEDAAAILEDRGYLLEAAERYELLELQKKTSRYVGKASALRVRYIELMTLTNLSNSQKESLLLLVSPQKVVCEDDNCSVMILQNLLREDTTGLLKNAADHVIESPLWGLRALELACKTIPQQELIEKLPGKKTMERIRVIYELAKNLKYVAMALCKQGQQRSPEESLAVSQAETFFDLIPKQFDPANLETNPLINVRLREALYNEKFNLIQSHGASSFHGFRISVDRSEVHSLLSKHISKKVVSLLQLCQNVTNEYKLKTELCVISRSTGICSLFECHKNHNYSTRDLKNYVNCIQLQILCNQELSDSFNEAKQRSFSSEEPWANMETQLENDEKSFCNQLLSILFQERHASFQSCTNIFDDDQQDSSNIIFLRKHTTNTLSALALDRFHACKLHQKREDITHTINYYRVLSLCKGKPFACNALNKEISRIEKHKHTQVQDFKRRKIPYFINAKRQVFPRLWLWATESVEDDVMNAISVIERIIKTSYRNTRVCKMQQVDMLEANSVALFCTLSLRYSEVKSPQILIPNTYLKALLTGEGGLSQLHGFGIPIKDVIVKYCHKQFDEVFQKAVEHIETTAEVILSNNLLSKEEKFTHDTGRFKKAFTLCVFLCCNAIIFSTSGRDMDTCEYKNENDLPSLPLQGNMRKLVAELQKILSQKLFPSYLENIVTCPSTFLDLLKFLNELHHNDQNMLCRLEQKSEEVVQVICSEGTQSACLMLENIPLDENHDIFTSWSKSRSFLDEIENRKALANQDEDKQGEKSEELNSRRKIARFVDGCMKPSFDADAAIVSFRHWKATFRLFFRVVRKRATEKRMITKLDQTDAQIVKNEVIQSIFSNIYNPLEDKQYFSVRKENIVKSFLGNSVLDSIECSCCGCVFTPYQNLLFERLEEFNRQGRPLPFGIFTKQYNKIKFGNVLGNHGAIDDAKILGSHRDSPFHVDNYVKFSNSLERLSIVLARLTLAQELLHQIIQCCYDEANANGISISSWYLGTAEQAQVHFAHVCNVINDMERAGQQWSMYPLNPPSQRIWDIAHFATDLPSHIESFYVQKQSEEADLISRIVHPSGENTTVENPITEMISESYLNPNATSFVPI